MQEQRHHRPRPFSGRAQCDDRPAGFLGRAQCVDAAVVHRLGHVRDDGGRFRHAGRGRYPRQGPHDRHRFRQCRMDHDPRGAWLDRFRYRQRGQDGEGAEQIFRQRHQAHGRHRFRGHSGCVWFLQRGAPHHSGQKYRILHFPRRSHADTEHDCRQKGSQVGTEWSLFFALFGGMLVAVIWP